MLLCLFRSAESECSKHRLILIVREALKENLELGAYQSETQYLEEKAEPLRSEYRVET
jgi:hypothetical protein